ncbi:MAG: dihydroorotate dehydrogenase [Planctomycetaceae bacterium]|jgi:dihydroorotate dehydrogenase (NAD+) catalytic subunit|nr:dihydroorotate dehydrogenase [Planctomycetaceae bacterium]
MKLSVELGRLSLANPVCVASGTFGYAKEMAGVFDLSRLGAIIPKTVTLFPRDGNPVSRAVETAGGLLNAIGLDNDGIDSFLEVKLPELSRLHVPILLSIAAAEPAECAVFGGKLRNVPEIAAIELNISCPNVSKGTDYGSDARKCGEMVTAMRRATEHLLFVKLTPNVTNIAEIAVNAVKSGADGVSAINTCLGMAIDWRKRVPRLGNPRGTGGLSGPAVKPIALRCVHEIHQAFRDNGITAPIIGIGGIASAEDVLEFMVAGAAAVQVGTANFYNPTVVPQILDTLPQLLDEAGISDFREIIGTLKQPGSMPIHRSCLRPQ